MESYLWDNQCHISEVGSCFGDFERFWGPGIIRRDAVRCSAISKPNQMSEGSLNMICDSQRDNCWWLSHSPKQYVALCPMNTAFYHLLQLLLLVINQTNDQNITPHQTLLLRHLLRGCCPLTFVVSPDTLVLLQCVNTTTYDDRSPRNRCPISNFI